MRMTPQLDAFDQQHEDEIRLGEYMTTSVRAEITRTQGTATCLLTVASFLGTGASAVLAATAPGNDAVFAAGPLTGAVVMLGMSVMNILIALRPRLPKPGRVTTGWPTLLVNDQKQYRDSAADFSEFLRQDATTLAGIAMRKFRHIRSAYTLAMGGFPLLIVGVAMWLLGV